MSVNQNENLITYKFNYTCAEDDKDVLLSFIKNYNSVLKYTYNRLKKGGEFKKFLRIETVQQNMNNVILNAILKRSAGDEALSLVREFGDRSICFGGKKLFTDYKKGLITKDALSIKRLHPLFCKGEANQKGNRCFRILSLNQIKFHHGLGKKGYDSVDFILNIVPQKSRNKDMLKLIELQNNKLISISYRIDMDYIYITFDLNKVRELKPYNPIENRIFAIDMNPNYIGYSVVDWDLDFKYRIIDSGTVSLKALTDYENSLKGKGLSVESKQMHYIKNKRHYELAKIVQFLIKKAVHYRCECFGVEELAIKSKNFNKGTAYNRLVNNQWCRGYFYRLLKKYCSLHRLQLIPVAANYSSFIGNLVFRNEQLPDMVLASVEIGRRCYEFCSQYIKKNKNKRKNIVFPELCFVKNRVSHALEVLGYSEKYESLVKLYNSLKNAKIKYRVSLNNKLNKVFRFFSHNSLVYVI